MTSLVLIVGRVLSRDNIVLLIQLDVLERKIRVELVLSALFLQVDISVFIGVFLRTTSMAAFNFHGVMGTALVCNRETDLLLHVYLANGSRPRLFLRDLSDVELVATLGI